MKRYVIRGGRDGKARLGVLTRVLQPSTGRLLDEIGLADRMSCLDLGCGAGEVTVEMARRVGAQGAVGGVDEDDAILQLARRDAKDAGLNHVSYQQAEAANLQLEPVFDLVYARFLLTHVGDGARVLDSMIRSARRPGIVAVEDIEFSGHVCYPDSRSFARYVELYREVVRRRGGDADIGPRLPTLFLAAGVEELRVRIVQPVALEGEAKSMAVLTLEGISGAVVAEGLASSAELSELLAELSEFADDPRTLMSLPRIFQVWGHRPG